MAIGTLSTEDCYDVAVKMSQYITSPPALLDSSSSTSGFASSAPPLQDHPTHLPLTGKPLSQSLLGHVTSSPQLSDHISPRFPPDSLIPKLPSLPNPIANHDRYVH